MNFRFLCAIVLVGVSLSFADTLTFTVRTTTYKGSYAPKHCLAIWVNNANDVFVKSLKVCANFPKYGQYLTKWNSYSKQNRTDAITSASLKLHQTHTLLWNCKDLSGKDVPDGDYKVYVEFTESNAAGKWLSYTFHKGPVNQTLSPANSGNFFDAKLLFTTYRNGVAVQNPIRPLSIPLLNGEKTVEIFTPNGRIVNTVLVGSGINEMDLIQQSLSAQTLKTGAYIFAIKDKKSGALLRTIKKTITR